MNDCVFILIISVVGYIVIYGFVEMQRYDVSQKIDDMFRNETDKKAFFGHIGEAIEPSQFILQIIVAAVLLAFWGKTIMQHTWVRALLFSGPILFFLQTILLEYEISDLSVIYTTYVIGIIIAAVFTKYQDIFVGFCTGVVMSYFLYFLMTLDYIKQKQQFGVTVVGPMFFCGLLMNVAFFIHAYHVFSESQLFVFKRFAFVEFTSFCFACLYLGYYNVHLTIAGNKIERHLYETHIEHFIVYIGCFLTFILGGSCLINLGLMAGYGNKVKPYFFHGNNNLKDKEPEKPKFRPVKEIMQEYY